MAVRLHPLLTAVVKGPAAQIRRRRGPRGFLAARGIGVGSDGWIDIPLPAFLIEHPAAGPVLVDTGAGTAGTTADLYGRLAAASYRDLRVHPLPALLRERGVEPRDVELVVMTHLHVDHACGLHLFPRATIAVAEAEWQAARRGRQTRGYRPEQFDIAPERLRLLPEEEVDLLEDGTLRVLPTPGHTRGHRSLAVALPDRMALLCADAAFTLDTLDGDARPAMAADRVAFEASLALLRALRDRQPDALVVPGHDMDAWSRLEPVYG